MHTYLMHTLKHTYHASMLAHELPLIPSQQNTYVIGIQIHPLPECQEPRSGEPRTAHGDLLPEPEIEKVPKVPKVPNNVPNFHIQSTPQPHPTTQPNFTRAQISIIRYPS